MPARSMVQVARRLVGWAAASRAFCYRCRVTTISVELSPQEEQRLRERARDLNVTPEELAAAVLKDGLATPDPDFKKILAAVLDKNRELYRRLA